MVLATKLASAFAHRRATPQPRHSPAEGSGDHDRRENRRARKLNSKLPLSGLVDYTFGAWAGEPWQGTRALSWVGLSRLPKRGGVLRVERLPNLASSAHPALE